MLLSFASKLKGKIMFRICCLFLIAVSSLLAGCVSHYRDACLYQRTGGSKPIVTVLPVLSPVQNIQETYLPWDVSSELTEQICKRFYDSSRLYILDGVGSWELAKELNNNNLKALSKLQMNNIGASQFLVVSELLDHKETPCKLGSAELGEIAATLALDFKIRVIDVRGQTPKVVFQELIHHDHLIPRAYLHCDYKKAAWGTESFERTPVGMAHSQLAREVVARVESYIYAAKA